jgi:hypothetical protein
MSLRSASPLPSESFGISEQDSLVSESGDFLGGTDSRSISRVLHIEALNRRQRRALFHSALGVEPVPHELRF